MSVLVLVRCEDCHVDNLEVCADRGREEGDYRLLHGVVWESDRHVIDKHDLVVVEEVW